MIDKSGALTVSMRSVVGLKSLNHKTSLDQTVNQGANARRRVNRAMANLEQSVFQQINQYRQQKGLAALTLNDTITQQARQHSQDMANSRAISHNGFDARIKAIGSKISWRGAAENVAYNAGFSDPVGQAVNGWLKSPGHLQNIVGNYNLTGIGVSQNSQGEYYFTQMFIRT
jgi:uncharacterized protein YkwD